MSDDEASRWPLGFVNTGRLLIQTFQRFEERLVEALQADGFDDITMAHLSALRHLDLEGLRIGDLASDAGVTKQAMGQMVKELKRRGWVEVRPDPTDGRARRVCYTEEGLRLIRKAQRTVGELEREFQTVLGEDSYTALRDGLSQLLSALSEPAKAHPTTNPGPDR